MKVASIGPHILVESHPEMDRTEEKELLAQKSALEPIQASETEEATRSVLDDETKKGIRRLHEFIHNSKSQSEKQDDQKKDRRRQRAIEAYKKMSEFEMHDEEPLGIYVNKAA